MHRRLAMMSRRSISEQGVYIDLAIAPFRFPFLQSPEGNRDGSAFSPMISDFAVSRRNLIAVHLVMRGARLQFDQEVLVEIVVFCHGDVVSGEARIASSDSQS